MRSEWTPLQRQALDIIAKMQSDSLADKQLRHSVNAINRGAINRGRMTGGLTVHGNRLLGL